MPAISGDVVSTEKSNGPITLVQHSTETNTRSIAVHHKVLGKV
jgi:hypothetical protein